MHFDFIVIGQGIAGTTLAWQLRRRRLRVLVIDRDVADGASHIAAGLITPVTGKRLAKSWRWDELFPAATAFYRSLEAETGASFFYERPSLRLFADEAERDEFHRRADGIIAGLVRLAGHIPDCFDAPFGGFEMPHAARLDVPRYLEVSRQRFKADGGFLHHDVNPTEDIVLLADRVRLSRLNVEARGVVFCRGFVAGADPWFGDIRFNAAKGEILTLRIPGLTEDRVIHRGIWLAPTQISTSPLGRGRRGFASRVRGGFQNSGKPCPLTRCSKTRSDLSPETRGEVKTCGSSAAVRRTSGTT